MVRTGLNIDVIRRDFPILQREVNGKPLVYLDNGATTQKPRSVIEKVNEIHSLTNSSIHRGVHHLSGKMTEEYENAREKVRAFLNAEDLSEIIFTSGTTGSVNLVAFSFGERFVSEGDEILISEMEHHSNIIPWQLLCDRKKAKLKVIPFDSKGELDLEAYRTMINDRTRIVAVVHASNSLGTVNPVKEMIRIAHDHDVPVLIDGAQAVQHGPVDVRDLDADFYVFSGHKIFGPTGIGVLYGKEALLDVIPPYQGGGDMVDCVSFERTTYNVLPLKFEAGTANYTGAIALGTALDYVQMLGMNEIKQHEEDLLQYASDKLEAIDGLRLFGKAKNKIAVISFLLGDIHPYDTGMILDKLGVAVRTGSHCTQPVMDHFEIPGTVRASMVFYNNREDIDRLTEAVLTAKKMLG